MRRLTAALAAAVLALLGTVALAGGASAAPGDVTISAPGEGGEDCTPLVQGTADPATEVFVLINGSEADVVADQSGAWEYQVTAPFDRGTTTFITAEVRDADGTAIGSAQRDYYCWPEPSQVTITSPTPGTVVGRSFDVRATASGTNRNLSLSLLLDGQVVVDDIPFDDVDAGTLAATVYLDDITDGPHTLQILGKDDFDREIASPKVSIVGDGTPPKPAALVSPAPGSTVTSRNFTFHGTGTPGDTVRVVLDGSGEPVTTPVTVQPDGTWTAPVLHSPTEPHNPFWFVKDERRTLGFFLDTYDPVGNEGLTAFSLTLDLRSSTAPAEPAPSTRPASAVPAVSAAAPAAAPELANTGSSTGPGTAVALLLIAVGLGLTRLSRRFLADAS